MTQKISELPRIRAMIRSDGTGELLIDGVSQHITAADEAGVREEIINRVTDAARAIHRAVRLTAADEQGQSPLIVHPNGDVEDDGAFIPTPFEPKSFTSAGANAVSGAVSATEFDTTDLDDAVLDADADAEVSQVEPAPSPRTHILPVTTFDGLVLDLGADADEENEQQTDLAPAPFSAPRSATEFAGSVPVSGGALAEVDTNTSPTTLTPSATATDDARVAPTGLDGGGPNLADFMNSRPPLVAGPALLGWQGTVRRLTGGLVSPSPGAEEMSHRAAVASVQRSLIGPRTIVVLNPKGGAHKTTATLLIAATFGIHRGGYTLAWDNNETMGTLGVRAQTASHTNTAVDLLRDLDNFAYSSSARVGDLDNYVRNQGYARFDALASDLDPAGAASIDDVAFGKLHAALSRFYRVLIIDTGNNMRASNWEAAVDAADQLVVVSTIREDTAYGAASLLDGLRQKGHADKVAQAVTILASPAKTADRQLSHRLHDHFSQLTRTVVDVPYDPALVAGGSLNYDALAPRTREAWLVATAAIAEGL